MALTEEQRQFAVEQFVALDVYRRFVLDVGNSIRNAAPSAATALARLREAKDYIRETIFNSFKTNKSTATGAGHLTKVIQDVLANALSVFQEYIE